MQGDVYWSMDFSAYDAHRHKTLMAATDHRLLDRLFVYVKNAMLSIYRKQYTCEQIDTILELCR